MFLRLDIGGRYILNNGRRYFPRCARLIPTTALSCEPWHIIAIRISVQLLVGFSLLQTGIYFSAMTLEDFEKELAATSKEKESRKRHREHRRSHVSTNQ